MRKFWISVLLSVLDFLIHYLQKRGVIEIESESPEEEG